MATYTCNSCGMSVNASCAVCNNALTNATLTKDDGSTVQISQCQVSGCEMKLKKLNLLCVVVQTWLVQWPKCQTQR